MTRARQALDVRGTAGRDAAAGRGARLLFLHGAGGGGRWLTFQARLPSASRCAPSHPGHGGSPAAEWIEHISDLAFHYLDLLDALGLERVHLVGASFGGWIAAEIAIMASHRLASLTLIDPVGIKVDGWIYPFLFGMDVPELVQTVFHNPMAALALAPPDQSRGDARAAVPAGRPRSPASAGTRTSTIRCSAGGSRASRRRRCSAGARTTGWRRSAVRRRRGRRRSRARSSACSGAPATCRTSRSPSAVADAIIEFCGRGRAPVKFYYFHLMPYLMDHDEPSSWVTLSNRHYDPKVGQQALNQYLDQLEYAERLGWDGLCVNEHHQNCYGTMPSPNVMAAMLVRRTSRAKIAILGNGLPLRENPLRLAEEIAMLDVVSGGRVISGFVRGISAEYFSTGVNPTHSRERFYEAAELILRAWTEPGPFAFDGRFYRYPYVNPWPRPLQQPHPPVWCPSQGSTRPWSGRRSGASPT